ncbi:MAG: sensor domain-containing protein [Bifidobacteriaceae bacterium]|jgi:signal transduction histidine kinase|nr:sensor domain-containing protein [Bifidobacteriaceae bacterium]
MTKTTPGVYQADGIVHSTAPEPPQPAARRLIGKTLRQSGYLLANLPIWLFAGVAVTCGIALGASTLVIWVGFPLLAGALTLAHWLARFDLIRLRLAGYPVDMPPPPAQPVPSRRAKPLRLVLGPITNPLRWREAAYAVWMFVFGWLSWVVTFGLWCLMAAGVIGVLVETVGRVFDLETSFNADFPFDIPDWLVAVWMILAGGALLAFALGPIVWLHQRVASWLLVPGKDRLARRVTQLEQARRQASAAETMSLRRIERDIHDGPQQELIRLGMDLATVQRRLESDELSAGLTVLGEARTRLDQAIADIRALTRGFAPPILQDRGLVAALSAVATASPVPVEVRVTSPPAGRLPEGPEGALYFAACELLANVAKHSGAQAAQLTFAVSLAGSQARLTVSDNGNGGAAFLTGHGLAGLRDRLAGLDGRIELASGPEGTAVTVDVPLTPDVETASQDVVG